MKQQRLTREQYKILMRRQPQPVTLFRRVSLVELSSQVAESKQLFNQIVQECKK